MPHCTVPGALQRIFAAQGLQTCKHFTLNEMGTSGCMRDASHLCSAAVLGPAGHSCVTQQQCCCCHRILPS